MTREQLVNKIAPEYVERVMALVDEGVNVMNYVGNTQKTESWYEFCSKRYDMSFIGSNIPLDYEQTEELAHHNLLEFSFPYFSSLLGEAFDRYRYIMFITKQEDSIMIKEGDRVMKLICVVEDYIRSEGKTYSKSEFVTELTSVVTNNFKIEWNMLSAIEKELADALALVKLKASLQSDKPTDRINSITFAHFVGGKQVLKSTRAIQLMSSVLIPYFCDRYLSKFSISKLEQEYEKVVELSRRKLHKVIREIYNLFLTHYQTEFKFDLKKDIYHFGIKHNKTGKYPGLRRSISIWIHDLLFKVDPSCISSANTILPEHRNSNEKVEFIRTRMEMDTSNLNDIDLPKEYQWDLFNNL